MGQVKPGVNKNVEGLLNQKKPQGSNMSEKRGQTTRDLINQIFGNRQTKSQEGTYKGKKQQFMQQERDERENPRDSFNSDKIEEIIKEKNQLSKLVKWILNFLVSVSQVTIKKEQINKILKYYKEQGEKIQLESFPHIFSTIQKIIQTHYIFIDEKISEIEKLSQQKLLVEEQLAECSENLNFQVQILKNQRRKKEKKSSQLQKLKDEIENGRKSLAQEISTLKKEKDKLDYKYKKAKETYRVILSKNQPFEFPNLKQKMKPKEEQPRQEGEDLATILKNDNK